MDVESKSNNASDSLQEVTVTARKRNELLIDTPVAVQFLSADQLQSSAITDLAGLAAAQETNIEGAVGGPITDTLKVRVSAKLDQMTGYLTNTAEPRTFLNPLAATGLGAVIPDLPATVSVEGAPRRFGPDNKTLFGRVVLDWKPTETFPAAIHALFTRVNSPTPLFFNCPAKVSWRADIIRCDRVAKWSYRKSQ
jgi:hypothetical protein